MLEDYFKQLDYLQREELHKLYKRNPERAINKVANEVCDSCYNEKHIVKWLEWLASTCNRFPMRKNHNLLIIEFYNALESQMCTDITQIPTKHLSVLQAIPERGLTEALVIYRYYQRLEPRASIMERYSLSKMQFTWIIRQRGKPTRLKSSK